MDRARINQTDPTFVPAGSGAPTGTDSASHGQRPVGAAAKQASALAPTTAATFSAASPSGASASHAILFVETKERSCDVCGVSLDTVEAEEADRERFSTSGAGMYLWSRGGEVIREEAPLCNDCGRAIGVTAMMRFQNEDEEG